MKKSIKKNKGFTLAELLVVVAIIGVLVAISIPIFTGQLEKARIATDKANVRAAKIAAVAEYLSSGATGAKSYYYDAGAGTVKDSPDNIKGYGKSTSTDTGAENTIPVSNGKANLVRVDVSDIYGEAPYKAYWEDGNGNSASGDSSGGGSGGGSSGGGGSGGSSASNAFDAKLKTVSTEWSPSISSITAGNVYSHNGNFYIALISNDNLDPNATEPKAGWSQAYYLKLTGKAFTSTDFTQQRNDVNGGDACKVGDVYYIYKDGGNVTRGPEENPWQWIKMIV